MNKQKSRPIPVLLTTEIISRIDEVVLADPRSKACPPGVTRSSWIRAAIAAELARADLQYSPNHTYCPTVITPITPVAE